MWKYSGRISQEARQRLYGKPSYAAIVQGICRTARISYTEPQPGTKAMRDHSRHVFLIEIDARLGDPFFSGPVGYRAAYARNIWEGEDANRQLIDELLPTLLHQKRAKPYASEVERSLSHWSAKVWILQKGEQYHECLLPTPPEILVPKWTVAWEEAKALGETFLRSIPTIDRDRRPRCHKAIRGVRLHGPVTKLRVIGAWINEAGRLVDPPVDKLTRSQDITETGFA